MTFEVFYAGRHAKVPSKRSHRRYTAEGCRFVGFTRRPRDVWPESSVLSSEPQILQRTAGATAGRTLTWEVSMTTDSPKERLFWGRGGLNATTIENETLKKRRVTLWRDRVLFLVPRSLERWFQPLLSLFDTILFPSVLSGTWGTGDWHGDTRADTRWNSAERFAGSPGVTGPAGHVQCCCDRLAFQCLSAALQCFQIRLQPAN